MKHRTRDDSGLTLAELMVVMMLIGLLSALVLSFVVSVSRNVSDSRVTNTNTNEASAATNEITRMLRGATNLRVKNQPIDSPAFVDAGKTYVTFYTVVDTNSLDTRPMLVRFEVTAEGNLVEKRWLPDTSSVAPYWTFSSAAGTPTSTRVVAHGLTARPGSANTLFTYLRSDQTTPIVGTGPNGSLTATQRVGMIGAVQVTVETQTSPGGRASSSVLTNTVGLRNLPEGSS